MSVRVSCYRTWVMCFSGFRIQVKIRRGVFSSQVYRVRVAIRSQVICRVIRSIAWIGFIQRFMRVLCRTVAASVFFIAGRWLVITRLRLVYFAIIIWKILVGLRVFTSVYSRWSVICLLFLRLRIVVSSFGSCVFRFQWVIFILSRRWRTITIIMGSKGCRFWSVTNSRSVRKISIRSRVSRVSLRARVSIRALVFLQVQSSIRWSSSLGSGRREMVRLKLFNQSRFRKFLSRAVRSYINQRQVFFFRKEVTKWIWIIRLLLLVIVRIRAFCSSFRLIRLSGSYC